ncbi:4-amino-4-deoxy-L-arabinose transferase [Nocardioides sp. ChNu-153]|nr:4-amino-4-deoxy-L-arabinose transferase [Nocardioides sp. ChNu-99]MDN7122986.1 4-amino-4-deoxy-L-arabinose transferase [Nocardioides sp. ChNu-153]
MLAAPARCGAARLLCVDGPAGSGKTTAAGALATALTADDRVGGAVTVLHMDDHYEGWDGLDAAPGRLARDVVGPLAAGGVGTYRRYDWYAGAFAETRRLGPVGPGDVVVLEGVGAGAGVLAPYRSLLVWVEAPPALRLRRGLERDGAAVEEHWHGWGRAEQAHFSAQGTRAAADLRLDALGRLDG